MKTKEELVAVLKKLGYEFKGEANDHVQAWLKGERVLWLIQINIDGWIVTTKVEM